MSVQENLYEVDAVTKWSHVMTNQLECARYSSWTLISDLNVDLRTQYQLKYDPRNCVPAHYIRALLLGQNL
jgi:hypothetical protein